MESVIKTFILLVEAFAGHQSLYIFVQVFLEHKHGLLGQAIFYKSIARVKCDMSVN